MKSIKFILTNRTLRNVYLYNSILKMKDKPEIFYHSKDRLFSADNLLFNLGESIRKSLHEFDQSPNI